MDAKLYWATVNETLQHLRQALSTGEQRHQPDFSTETCFVVSRGSLQRNSVAGQVTLVTHKHAAKLITDETHAVASDQEIAEFKEKQAASAEEARRLELGRKAQIVMHVDRDMKPLADKKTKE